MRKVTPRKRGSKIVRLVDPFRRREIHVESGLEENVGYVLVARPELREILEQQRPNKVVSSMVHRYHVDYLTVGYDGSRVAYEIKYADDVDKEVTDRLKVLANDAGYRFASEYRTITEGDISAVAIANARLIVDCGCDADLDAQGAVRAALAGRRGITTARRIGTETGLGWRGERAAFALVQSGLLLPREGMRLDRDTTLTIRKAYSVP